jgi:hypothetical protein
MYDLFIARSLFDPVLNFYFKCIRIFLNGSRVYRRTTRTSVFAEILEISEEKLLESATMIGDMM